MGTQNPLDLAGTYPLPLVQLDRFLLKIPMTYVDSETELAIVKDSESIAENASCAAPVVTRQQVLDARKAAAEVTISESLLKAIVDIVQATRTSPLLQFGASTDLRLCLREH